MLQPPEKTTVAPRGKRCSACLCCAAVIVFSGEALCAACDDGTHPALPESHNKFEPGSANCPAQEEGEATPTGSIARAATSSEPSNAKPLKEAQMKVTPELKQLIREAGPDESCASIAKRLGMKPGTVWWHRNEIRKERNRKDLAKVKEAGLSKAISLSAPTLSRIVRPDLAVEARFLVADKIVDNWWRGLKLGDKAAIFSANYVIRVEGTVD